MLGRRPVTRLKKFTWAEVLKAGDQLEGEGKLQLSRGNGRLNAGFSGGAGSVAGPAPAAAAGRSPCLRGVLPACRWHCDTGGWPGTRRAGAAGEAGGESRGPPPRGGRRAGCPLRRASTDPVLQGQAAPKPRVTLDLSCDIILCFSSPFGPGQPESHRFDVNCLRSSAEVSCERNKMQGAALTWSQETPLSWWQEGGWECAPGFCPGAHIQ